MEKEAIKELDQSQGSEARLTVFIAIIPIPSWGTSGKFQSLSLTSVPSCAMLGSENACFKAV